jgi:hypothetical protein
LGDSMNLKLSGTAFFLAGLVVLALLIGARAAQSLNQTVSVVLGAVARCRLNP